MNRRYRVKKTDKNEKEIVKALRSIFGVSVETGHDDILVGYLGKTYWFEIKNPDRNKKDGSAGSNGKSTDAKQAKLLNDFNGHYSIVTDLDQILEEIGIQG